MTDFFNKVKDFVVRHQPATGRTEVMGMSIQQYVRGVTHKYRLDHFDKCQYVVEVDEKDDGTQNIWAEENCNGNVTNVYDENGDGKIGKGESVTVRAAYYASKEKPRSNPNGFYQGVVQKTFLERLAEISRLEQFIPPQSLKGKIGAFVAGKDHLEFHLTPAASDYLREALEKTKAILAKVQPNLKENKAVVFDVRNIDGFMFGIEKGILVISLPTDPKVGHSVLIGFILTVLNVPQDQLDENGKRAIEIFIAYAEMKGNDYEGFIGYCIDQKIYPANLVPIMEERVLTKADGSYKQALAYWQDANPKPTLEFLEAAKKELARRPPPSDSDQSTKLDEKTKAIEELFQKVETLKRFVKEGKTEEGVRLLEKEGLIHPTAVSKRAQASAQFRDIKITALSWHQEGHLLLDVNFAYRCEEGDYRLFKSRTKIEKYSLDYFRQDWEEKFEESAAKVEKEANRCEEKALKYSVEGGWRGLEYDQFWNSQQLLYGGPRLQLTFYPQTEWESERNENFVALGWNPYFHRFDIGGGEVQNRRSWSFREGIEFSYQRENFEKESPHNVLKFGFTLQGRFYPFHSRSYLDRFALGLNADLGLIAGVAFKDGWLNDVRWVPLWGALHAMAGIDF